MSTTQSSEPHEPAMVTRRTFHTRRADSDVAHFVDEIFAALAAGSKVVDLSCHDSRGTTIELRVNEPKE